LIAVIGDEDTVTGFLLAGIGERNVKGETNFLIVDSKSTPKMIEDTFNRYLSAGNISIILVNQHVNFI
jgi:V-type H+-transporting ATPase subunit F